MRQNTDQDCNILTKSASIPQRKMDKCRAVSRSTVSNSEPTDHFEQATRPKASMREGNISMYISDANYPRTVSDTTGHRSKRRVPSTLGDNLCFIVLTEVYSSAGTEVYSSPGTELYSLAGTELYSLAGTELYSSTGSQDISRRLHGNPCRPTGLTCLTMRSTKPFTTAICVNT